MLKDIRELNRNLKDLIEVIRDFNTMTGGFLGYKVKYEKKEKNETDNNR